MKALPPSATSHRWRAPEPRAPERESQAGPGDPGSPGGEGRRPRRPAVPTAPPRRSKVGSSPLLPHAPGSGGRKAPRSPGPGARRPRPLPISAPGEQGPRLLRGKGAGPARPPPPRPGPGITHTARAPPPAPTTASACGLGLQSLPRPRRALPSSSRRRRRRGPGSPSPLRSARLATGAPVSSRPRPLAPPRRAPLSWPPRRPQPSAHWPAPLPRQDAIGGHRLPITPSAPEARPPPGPTQASTPGSFSWRWRPGSWAALGWRPARRLLRCPPVSRPPAAGHRLLCLFGAPVQQISA